MRITCRDETNLCSRFAKFLRDLKNVRLVLDAGASNTRRVGRLELRSIGHLLLVLIGSLRIGRQLWKCGWRRVKSGGCRLLSSSGGAGRWFGCSCARLAADHNIHTGPL